MGEKEFIFFGILGVILVIGLVLAVYFLARYLQYHLREEKPSNETSLEASEDVTYEY